MKMTLKEMRTSRGYKAVDVATLCSVTYQSLRNWENAATIPSVINIEDLLSIYGYNYEDIDLSPFRKLAEEKERQKSMVLSRMKQRT